jgi:hypothetical protein
MSMLAAGTDIGIVAILLGHEGINATHRYVVSDMRLKEGTPSKVHRDWQIEAKEHRVSESAGRARTSWSPSRTFGSPALCCAGLSARVLFRFLPGI